MKIILVLFFQIFIIFDCMCQDSNSAIIETNNRIKSIDGFPVNGKTINVTPGNHFAETVDMAYILIGTYDISLLNKRFSEKNINFTVVEGKIYTLNPLVSTIPFEYGYYKDILNESKINFKVEAGKIYTVNSFVTNYYDTINRTSYFNHNLPQLIDKKTTQVVSTIEYPILLNPISDTCRGLHLNYNYNVLDTTQLTIIKISSDIAGLLYKSLSITGWTKDNYYISYNLDLIDPIQNRNFKELATKDIGTTAIYLKPGYYKLAYHYYEYDNRTGSLYLELNSINFMAEACDTIFDIFGGKLKKLDNNFKAFHDCDLKGIYFLPDGQHGWIVGENAIIISTKNGGKTWQFSQDGKNYSGFTLINTKSQFKHYSDVHFIDSLTGWVVGFEIIKQTKDGGLTWTNQNLKSSIIEPLSSVRFFNDRFGFASKSATHRFPVLYYTTNGGVNWKLLDKEKPSFYRIYAFAIDNIWKVKGFEILHSTDMCKTWSFSLELSKTRKIGGYLAISNDFIYFIDPMHGWILQDGIQCTKDGGKTWTKQNINTTPDLVFFINKDIGWALTHNGLIYKTNDGGENWLFLNTNNVIRNITKAYFIDENKGWIVSENGFFYNTTDGGINWNVYNILDLIYE